MHAMQYQMITNSAGESHVTDTHAGQCARCEMVCTDPEAGKRGGPEPLLTLAAYRRTRGRIHFGILLDHAPAAGNVETLRVGNVVDVQQQ